MSGSAQNSLLFQQVPVLLKPPKRSKAKALPCALHVGLSSTLSVLLFGVINIAVTEGLGPRNQWSILVQRGTMMAMATICILAMPNLGNSVAKGIQRITGVMVGGWLFYGLFAACQLWWFLSVCLAVWAFMLVALSFLLTGNQYLSPVALITAFIVAVNFDTVEQALVMTAVKTVAISGSIVLYTLVSTVVFPVTATQQVLDSLADALAGLHKLAEQLLVTGQPTDDAAALVVASTLAQPQQGEGVAPAEHSADEKDADSGLVRASPRKDVATPATTAPTDSATTALAPAGGKPWTSWGSSKSRKASTVIESKSAVLASSIAHSLQLAEQLLPATRKEHYVGSLGSYRCFMPSIKSRGLNEAACFSALLSASQVLRCLLMIMSEYGSVPLARRPPPGKLVDPAAQQLVVPLAQQAVETLQALSAALPASGPNSTAVCTDSLAAYSQTLQALLAGTVHWSGSQQPSEQQPLASMDNTNGEAAQSPASRAASRWQHAAAAAAGFHAPGQAQSADHKAAAFCNLLCNAVSSDEAQIARWCSTLVLARQLGIAMAGLTRSLNQLLPLLPGAQHSLAAESGTVVEDCAV